MFYSADLMLSNLGFSSTPKSAEFNRTTIFTDRDSLDAAITAWIANDTAATAIYGDINTWDVREITDFSELFKDKTTFNSNISNWVVSNGENFNSMFANASSDASASFHASRYSTAI